jgi:hypothetical protein
MKTHYGVPTTRMNFPAVYLLHGMGPLKAPFAYSRLNWRSVERNKTTRAP